MKPLHTGILISPRLNGMEGQQFSPLVEITHSFTSYAQGHDHLKSEAAGVAFLDISPDPGQGVKWAQKIRKRSPETRIFLLDNAPAPETILQGFRIGALDFLPLPGRDSEDISRRIASALEREGGAPPQGEMITQFSLKGGVGLTTVAINLADQIARLTGEKVLLLDLNLFMGDITGYLDIRPRYTPYDLVTDLDRMDPELLFSSLFCHDRGFHILTALEEINDSDSIAARDLSAMIAHLKSQFDYIVADAPHDFSRRTLGVIEATDTLMVMAQQSLPSVKSVQKILEFLSDIGFDSHKISLILNRYLKSGGLSREDLEASFSRPIDYCIGNDYPACIKAATRGIPLGQVSPGSRVAGDLAALARGITGTEQEKPAGLAALLARIKP